MIVTSTIQAKTISNINNNSTGSTFPATTKTKSSAPTTIHQLHQRPASPKSATAFPNMDTHKTQGNTLGNDPAKLLQQQALADLLGSQFKNWPYSENSLIHAINLKAEQEKTKQEYYKLENLNRSMELLKHSILAKVPAKMIPLIFAGLSMSQESIDALVKDHTSKDDTPETRSKETIDLPILQAIPTGPRPGPPVAQYHHHERSKSISTPRELKIVDRDEFETPPMPTNFRFGGDHMTTPQSVKQNPPSFQQSAVTPPRQIRIPPPQAHRHRQLSPAKLGAQAVASLNNRFRTFGSHSRTTSLPPQVSIPESSAISFHREEKKTPSLPVVKTPAVPSNQPVILQHQLIQFHHWTPRESDSSSNKKRRKSDEPMLDLESRRSSLGPSGEPGAGPGDDQRSDKNRKYIVNHHRAMSDTSLTNPLRFDKPNYPNILSNDD